MMVVIPIVLIIIGAIIQLVRCDCSVSSFNDVSDVILLFNCQSSLNLTIMDSVIVRCSSHADNRAFPILPDTNSNTTSC